MEFVRYIMICVLSCTVLGGAFLTGCSVNNNSSQIDSKLQKDPSTKVIFDYGENINNKNYSKALDNLGSILRESYSGSDDIHLKNIKYMDLKKIIDKTGKENNSHWALDERNIGKVDEYKVFYVEIDIKVRDTSLSDLKNGINYFKVITVKEKGNSEWKIGEMSSAEASWGNE